MRTVVVALLLFVVVSPSYGDEPPIPSEKWELEYISKMWGMKLKNLTFNSGSTFESGRYTILVELTKDLNQEELKAAKKAFRPNQGAVMAFYFFDKDNTVIGKQFEFALASEITGVKGDAFRFTVGCPFSLRDNIKDVMKVKLRESIRE
jgi:hypothetical protein